MNSTPLVIPFVFLPDTKTIGDKNTLGSARTLVDQACSDAQAVCITSWVRDPGRPISSIQAGLESVGGAAIGCDNGTVFLFRRSIGSAPYPLVEIDSTPSSRPTSPAPVHSSRRSFSHSRSSTPSSLSPALSPFTMSHWARSVSGVSTEQVQAPKNYVDFDDEPEKLKEYLKSGVREKSVTDRLIPSFDKGVTFEKSMASPPILPSSPSTIRLTDAKSLLSATQSPALTARSISSPPSPSLLPSSVPSRYSLILERHIFPPRFGEGCTVTGLETINHGRHVMCLQRNGDLSIISIADGSCCASIRIPASYFAPPIGANDIENPRGVWIWTRLNIFDDGESIIIMTCATMDESAVPQMSFDSDDNGQQQGSRVTLLEIRKGFELDTEETRIEKVGEWFIDASADCITALSHPDGSFTLCYMDLFRQFMVQRLRITAHASVPGTTQLREDSTAANLALTFNPFKPKVHQNAGEAHVNEGSAGRIELESPVVAGEIPSEWGHKGLRVVKFESQLCGFVWSDHEFIAFQYNHMSLDCLCTMPCENVRDMVWIGHDTFAATYPERVDIVKLTFVDANNDQINDNSVHAMLHPQLVSSVSVANQQALQVISAYEVLTTSISKKGRRRLEIYKAAPENTPSGPPATVIWKAFHKNQSIAPAKHVTYMLPLELNLVVLGYSDGTIESLPLKDMANVEAHAISRKSSDIALNGFIVDLHVVQNSRTTDRVIIGGADDGSVAIWALNSLKLLARWTIFITPLVDVVQVNQDRGGPLRGCTLCVSLDGTIAVIAIDEYQFLYVVPGSQAALNRICVGGDNLLLMYANARTRLWDAKTKEFWRSMSLDKAEEMLGQGGWTEVPLDHQMHSLHGGFASLGSKMQGIDAANTLLVDLEPLLTQAVSLSRSASDDEQEKLHALTTLDGLRALLGALLTPGLNSEIDLLCTDKFKLPRASKKHSNGSTSLTVCDSPQSAWCISAEASAAHAIAIVSILRTLNHFEDVADDTNTIIAILAASLSQIGNPYYSPSLPFLARWWFEASAELRSAARTLFDAGVANMSVEETISLVERWQHHLPCLQPDAERKLPRVAMALFLCGYIATEKYNLLSTNALNDISKSIMIYLHDDDVSYKLLAIDLCSRGFHIWQQYVDAMEMLRSLFTLATNSRKESISSQNAGPQARLAVLQIATHSTALFMTTLSLDILHPRDLDHRKSVMQLMAFLIKKVLVLVCILGQLLKQSQKPLVIYPNLPRLIEAVVKSLDPNSNSNREAVLDTATEILGHVVKTFPTVDFHMGSQRLAVGTIEGAIIMYDLKTATRLYVLECHKKRLAACSFSPDGRRLVTVSLEEGLVLVWKVGSSFTSFFNPGAPPRQGHAGSEPYKSLKFNVGDEANMSVEDTLQAVRFEWAAERSTRQSEWNIAVCLRIMRRDCEDMFIALERLSLARRPNRLPNDIVSVAGRN
ncbi:hypothetical protein EW146_g3520 [Bondarzewia mesenterica]|uniref:Uncharacterized protein n=1 Tax=Bondarzewia mesenterica TaxID=1095465 RepID=A0A4S4LXU2_9AGAM|nr:hypothetical protein EW146_g3520 [Bondarzewia mesenterica]